MTDWLKCAEESCKGPIKYAVPLLGPSKWPSLTYEAHIGYAHFCEDHFPYPLRIEFAQGDLEEARECLEEAKASLLQAEADYTAAYARLLRLGGMKK